jgi:Zn-dependent protease
MRRFFSRQELRDILVSMLVLCVVFSYPEFLYSPLFFLTACLAVGVAFIGHELAHKFTAIREGFWSEYRLWPQGLMFALLFALATNGSIIFAAPGAVYFSGGNYFGRPSRGQLTRISMAGISFNIALMWISLAASIFTGFFLFAYMAFINGWLAIFNMLPFGGLDGQKLLRLDSRLWATLFILAVSGFALSWFVRM